PVAVLAFFAVLMAGWAAQPSALRVIAWLEQSVAEQRADVPWIPVLFGYRDDYSRGVHWSPESVIAMLSLRPDHSLALGNFGPGYPNGSPVLRAIGDNVNNWQRAIADWNANHDPDLDPGRICVDWRPDLVFKHIDGSGGEVQCGTLLDHDQCAPSPCWAHL